MTKNVRFVLIIATCLFLLQAFTLNKTPLTFGEIARRHLEDISEKIGVRPPGSEAEASAAEYIQIVLKGLNYDVTRQDFSFTSQEDGASLKSANLIAVKKGDSERQIIVGAHYDSSSEGGKGADDNASGVALLLELANRIKDVRTAYTIRLIAFGSEENYMDGSKYYVSHMEKDEIKNTVVMVNLDSLISGDHAYVYGKSVAGSARDWIASQTAELGLEVVAKKETDMFKPDGSHCECSDIDAFLNAGIPFVLFETNKLESNREGMVQTDEKYGVDGAIRHTEYDEIAYIDQNFPGRIDQYLNLFGNLAYKILVEYRE